jgi:RNA polymerase sigma factor (sigma-70 family)
MQVTYFEAFLRIGDFTPYGEGAFYKWLLRIAENNLRDAIKELGRDKRTPPEKRIEPLGNSDSFQALYERLGTTSTTPSRELARGEAQGFLESAISRLPPDYQKVVRLYDLEGGSVAEVTAALGRSKGALFMLRARAHDRLRDILGTGTQFAGGA